MSNTDFFPNPTKDIFSFLIEFLSQLYALKASLAQENTSLIVQIIYPTLFQLLVVTQIFYCTLGSFILKFLVLFLKCYKVSM